MLLYISEDKPRLELPTTIPPELYFINQFITRDKYTITTVLSENGPPSLRAEARKEDRLRTTAT